MKLKKTLIYTLLVLIFSIFISSPISAAIDTKYTALSPLPGTTECNDTTFTNCKTELKTYLPGLFNLSIGIAAALAFIMLVWGGIQYMTTDALSGKSEGRERAENAIYGLLLVIGAYTILYTINPKILNFDLNVTPTNLDYSVIAQADRAAIAAASNTGTVPGSSLLTGATLQDDANNRSLLKVANIGVNNPPCTPTRTSACTNLNGLPEATLTALANVQQAACNGQKTPSCTPACLENGNYCAITVTGGTETFLHNPGTTHVPGNGTVDLASTVALNSYLAQTNPQANSPVNNLRVQVNGLTFTYETAGANAANNGAHWHVTTQP